MRDWPHDAIYVAAVWYISKKCMHEHEWRYTRLLNLHGELRPEVSFEPGELPIVSCYLDRDRWFVMTSGRLQIRCFGQPFAVSPLDIKRWNLGDFKTRLVPQIGNATFQKRDGTSFSFQYETGYASMALIYYLLFWDVKFPALDKLDINRLRVEIQKINR
jgi:hypothetical protein